MAPVGQNLDLECLSKGVRRASGVPFVTGEAVTGRHQCLQVLDQVIAAHVPLNHPGEVASLAVQGCEELLAKGIVRAFEDERRVPHPGVQAHSPR